MPEYNGEVGMSGDLVAQHLRAPQVNKAKGLRTPWGRVFFTKDRGDSVLFANQVFATNLNARHYDGEGKLVHEYDLGSGLVTNCGVLGMIYDSTWASPSGSSQATLAKMNFHGVGTGATAAAATDVQLQTPSTTNYTGAPSYQTGTITSIPAANSQKWQTVCTVSFTGSIAVAEWGLFNSATNTVAGTGSPFTATSATSATVTGTPLTASSTTAVGTHQSLQIRPTTTSTVYGLAVTNTTSVITVPAWYTISGGTVGSTPGTTEAYTVVPNMWDHKVFSAINVVSGDSIQFTYQLTAQSGG